MNLLESIGQGLRGAGAVMSAPVYESQNREREQFEQVKQQRNRMLADQTIRAIENGSLDPQKGKMVLEKLGMEDMATGPSMQTQKLQSDMQGEQRRDQVRAAAKQRAFGKPMVDTPVTGEGVVNPDGTGTLPTVTSDAVNINERQMTYANTLIESGEPELVKEGESLLKTIREKEDKQSPLGLLISERTRAAQQYGENHPIVKTYDNEINDKKNKSAETLKAGVNKGKKEYFYMKDGVPVWTGIEAPATEPLVKVGFEEKAEGKAVGEGLGKQYLSIQDAARLSARKSVRFDRLNELLSGVETGKLTPLGTEIAAFAKSVGFDIDPKLGNKQAAVALGNEIALELRNPSGGAGMPGALSDKDLDFLKTMRPGLETTTEGRKLMSETTKKLAQRDAEVARMARAYRKKHGGFDDGFFDELEDFSEKNPLFGDMTSPGGNIKTETLPEGKPIEWNDADEKRLNEIEQERAKRRGYKK